MLTAHVGAAEHVEHRSDVYPNVALEGHYLLGPYLDIAVDVGLEGARVGDHDSWEVKEGVDAVRQGLLA